MDEDSDGSKDACIGWGADPQGEGQEGANFGGCPGRSKALAIFGAPIAAAFVAKGISQSAITSCSRRDHSVCRACANDKYSETLWARAMRHRPRRMGDCTARAKLGVGHGQRRDTPADMILQTTTYMPVYRLLKILCTTFAFSLQSTVR